MVGDDGLHLRLGRARVVRGAQGRGPPVRGAAPGRPGFGRPKDVVGGKGRGVNHVVNLFEYIYIYDMCVENSVENVDVSCC